MIFFLLIVSIYVFFEFFRNSKSFLNLFFFIIIIGSGPLIAGHAIFDECWILILLIGFFLKKILVPSNVVIKKPASFYYVTYHSFFFYLLVFYLFLSSIRGMVFLDDLRMFRWIFFFIILGLLNFILNNYRFSINRRKVIKIIFYLSNLYFILYFLFGLFFEIFLELSRYDIQGNVWVGTSATIPIILYCISIILFYEEFKTKNITLKIFLSIILIFFIAVYYDSRASIIMLILTTIYYFFISFRNKIYLMLNLAFVYIFIFLVLINSSPIKHSVLKYLPYEFDNYDFSLPKVIDMENDVGRIISIQAAHLTVKNAGFLNSFFGSGWYTSRNILMEPVNKLRAQSGLDYLVGEVYQPSAYNAIIVDTGYIGLILFFINFLLSVITLFKCNAIHKFYLSLILSTIAIFSMIGNFTPLLLFYILIMPNSPIYMMVNTNEKYSTKKL
jgi:hypothetical protein